MEISKVGWLFLEITLFSSFTIATFNSTLPTIPPQDIVEEMAHISTGNPSNCVFGTKFYPQPVDHATFNGDYNDTNATFLQQYEIVDKYYKPGGPLFFYPGVESSSIYCVENQGVADWAERVGALVIVLEQRYFGLSTPYGLNYTEYDGWDPNVYKHLTLENTLRDGLSFITWIKTVAYPEMKNSKVLVSSGSYGGILAALFKTQYPEYIDGAVALSPITNGLISDPYNPLIFAMSDTTSMVIHDYSIDAAKKVKQGFDQIREFLAKGEYGLGQYETLRKLLLLCIAPDSPSQSHDLLTVVLQRYLILLQRNWNVTGRPFYWAMEKIVKAQSPMAAMTAVMQISLQITSSTCIDWRYPYQSSGPFLWLRCTEIPYPIPLSTEESIFGEILPDYSARGVQDPLCEASFGIPSIEGGHDLQVKLKLDDESLQNTERLIVVQGLLDPGVSLGPRSWHTGARRGASRNMLVSDSTHTEVGIKANFGETEANKRARQFIMSYLVDWYGTR